MNDFDPEDVCPVPALTDDDDSDSGLHSRGRMSTVSPAVARHHDMGASTATPDDSRARFFVSDEGHTLFRTSTALDSLQESMDAPLLRILAKSLIESHPATSPTHTKMQSTVLALDDMLCRGGESKADTQTAVMRDLSSLMEEGFEADDAYFDLVEASVAYFAERIVKGGDRRTNTMSRITTLAVRGLDAMIGQVDNLKDQLEQERAERAGASGRSGLRRD